MTNHLKPAVLPLFTYTHFATDGKLDNIIESLEITEADHLCLAITEPSLDDPLPDRSTIIDRLTRTKSTIARLRHRGISVDVVLPGLLACPPCDENASELLKLLYSLAGFLRAKTIWLNDSTLQKNPHWQSPNWLADDCLKRFNRKFSRRITSKQLREILSSQNPAQRTSKKQQQIKSDWLNFQKQTLLTLAAAVQRAAHRENPKVPLGLIAAQPCHYPCAITLEQLARRLAGQNTPLLAQPQGFEQDTDRTGVLQTAQRIAASSLISAPQANHSQRPTLEPVGIVDHYGASGFHKSAEAMQIQINLNLLFGLNRMIFNGFDEMGTDPGSANPYLLMQQNRQQFINRLTRLMPSATPTGIRVIQTTTHRQPDPFSIILSRMGIPTLPAIPPTAQHDHTQNAVSIITGDVAETLTRKQLTYLFRQGVLLDAPAAEILHNRGYADLLGVEITASRKEIHFEILTDQSFASSFYGYRTALWPSIKPRQMRLITPVHPNVRNITTLGQKNRIANIPGITIFDNFKKNQRSAVLPYDLQNADLAPLLTTQRQRHFQELFCWLSSAPLPCAVENAVDLVPFYFLDTPHRRSILALLNIGFDWAIDTRIRLGQLPKKAKRLRELNEDGKYHSYPDFQLARHHDYNYIQLTEDTAVPPMQMALFVID